MTGFYPSKTRVFGNIGKAGGNPLDQLTIAPELQKAGYYTGYFGKWHLGKKKIAEEGWDQKKLKADDSLSVTNAVRFLKERANAKEPFALYVSIVNPHDIYHFSVHKPERDIDNTPLPVSWQKETFENKPKVQKEFMTEDQGKIMQGVSESEWKRYRDYYRAKTKMYDDNVGTILNELKRQGLWDKTIVIITSDHGDMDANHRLIYKGPFMYEHLIRIPLMIHIPEKFGGIQSKHIKDTFVVNVDIVPTIRELCNLTGKETDGRSLVPLLTGKGDYKQRDFVVGQYYGKQKWVSPIRMIRTQRYKLNKYIGYRNELYDLKNDPFELNNLANNPEYSKIKEDLSRKLDAWIKSNNDPFYSQKPTNRAGEPLK